MPSDRDYTAQMSRQGSSRDKAVQTLNALSRLWVFDSAAEHTLGIAEPPWHQEGADDFLPAATPRGENATDPITPATMEPLLTWALRMTEEYAQDILAAWELKRSMAQRAGSATATLATRVSLLTYLADITEHDRARRAAPPDPHDRTGKLKMTALDERDRIRAAMDRILAGARRHAAGGRRRHHRRH